MRSRLSGCLAIEIESAPAGPARPMVRGRCAMKAPGARNQTGGEHESARIATNPVVRDVIVLSNSRDMLLAACPLTRGARPMTMKQNFVILALLLLAPLAVLRAETPDDARLQPLKDLNGYFPFTPPKTKAE